MTNIKRLGAAAAVVTLLLVGAVGVAQASPPTAAEATFTQTANTGFELGFPGPNTIIESTNVGSVSGTLSGTFEDSLKVVIHPNGTFTAHNRITCVCTVAGNEGVVDLVTVNTGQEVSPDTSIFEGSAVITGATGELAGLRGVFKMEGMVDIPTSLSTFTLTGQIHSHP